MVTIAIFGVAAAVSLLSMSWLLVSRLERIGERLGLSEAILGLVAALAADAPEVTSAVTALTHQRQRIGAGVVLGSNVFNLAALLGLARCSPGGSRCTAGWSRWTARSGCGSPRCAWPGCWGLLRRWSRWSALRSCSCPTSRCPRRSRDRAVLAAAAALDRPG